MIGSRRYILIASAVLAALLLALIVPNFRRGMAQLSHPDPVGPTAYSKSAIGHAAFYHLLNQLEIDAEISEIGSGAHVGPGDVLLVAEPRTDKTTLSEVTAMLNSRTVLLVLPKRTGKPDRDRPYWLAQDKLVAEGDWSIPLRKSRVSPPCPKSPPMVRSPGLPASISRRSCSPSCCAPCCCPPKACSSATAASAIAASSYSPIPTSSPTSLSPAATIRSSPSASFNNCAPATPMAT
jgi:hypothetical protein